MSTPEPERLAYSVDEAAAALGVRPWHIRQAIHQQLIVPRRVGNFTRIDAEDLRRWFTATLPEQHKRKRKIP